MMLRATAVEVLDRPELRLRREVSTRRLDDLVVGLVEVERLSLRLSNMPRRVDEHLDTVELRVTEIHRPCVAVTEGHDLGDPIVGGKRLLQLPQVVEGA